VTPYLIVRRSAHRINRALGRRVEVPRTSTLPPVFVGGTGRSGTTIVARLLGLHPAYHTIATEMKFHSVWRGLPDVARGRTSYGEFRELMLDRWMERLLRQPSKPKTTPDTVREALDDLSGDLWKDPWQAGARFTARLLDPIPMATGKAGWIEQTPTNAANAPGLLRMFPDARFIVCLRDGRDTAASVVARHWGPTNHLEALDWWGGRMANVKAGLARLPAGRALELHLESLVADDRERTYARLLEFLELDDEPAMRAFFDERMTADGAHIGRWREDVPEAERAAFIARYEELMAGMAAGSITAPPLTADAGTTTEAVS
jgi:hypothetical protein